MSHKNIVLLVCVFGLMGTAPSCAKRRPPKAKDAAASAEKSGDGAAKEVSKTMSALADALSKVAAAEATLKESGLELVESTSGSSSRAGYEVSVSEEALKSLTGAEATTEAKSKANGALLALGKELADAQNAATLTDASTKEEKSEAKIRSSVSQVLKAKAVLVQTLLDALAK